jgi:hypothetical protein
MLIITAKNATEGAAQARAKRVSDAITKVLEMGDDDPFLHDVIQNAFGIIEASFQRGLSSADLHLDSLFGEGKWSYTDAYENAYETFEKIFRDLGYRVENSCSSNTCAERIVLHWGPIE